MFWQLRLEKLAANLRNHDIPVRIALWNGQGFDLGTTVKVTIHITNSEGLRHLLSQPGLARFGVRGRAS